MTSKIPTFSTALNDLAIRYAQIEAAISATSKLRDTIDVGAAFASLNSERTHLAVRINLLTAEFRNAGNKWEA